MVQEQIITSVYAAMRGEVDVPRIESGWCLRTTRRVLERALGWYDEELFDRFPNKIETNAPSTRAYYARDIQRSFREAGWGIPLSEVGPGDVLAYYRAAKNKWGDYVGHIALMMPGQMVFENINPAYRVGAGAFSSGALSLTPLKSWGLGQDIEAFRIPEGLL